MSSASLDRRARHRRPASNAVLNWLAGYSIVAGAACLITIYDGTARSFAIAVGVFALGAILLAMIVSGVRALLRARRSRAESSDDAHAVEREQPTIPAALIWGHRLAVPLIPGSIALALVGMNLSIAAHNSKRDELPGKLAYMAVALSIFGLIAVIKWFNRRIERAADDWRAERRLERHPELATARRISTPTLPDTSEVDGPPRVTRSTADGSRLRRRPRGRARVHSIVEWVFIVFLVVGMPTLIHFLGAPNGLFSYVAIGFTLLAITNRVDSWAGSKVWTPGNAAAEDRKRERLESGRDWLSAEPPKLLRYARSSYLVFVVAGFCYGLVWPFLRGQEPAERYPLAAAYVAGFQIGLAVLAPFERRQRRLERDWLHRRNAERAERSS
jgi:hypothetical protein